MFVKVDRDWSPIPSDFECSLLFSQTCFFNKAKKSSLPYYLSITGKWVEKKKGFMPSQ